MNKLRFSVAILVIAALGVTALQMLDGSGSSRGLEPRRPNTPDPKQGGQSKRGDETRTSPDVDHAWRVVDSRSRAPLDKVMVDVLRHNEVSIGQIESDAQGMFSLAGETTFSVVLWKPDYSRKLIQYLDPKDGDRTIALDPARKLIVDLTNAAGGPVTGYKASLFPGFAADRVTASWRQHRVYRYPQILEMLARLLRRRSRKQPLTEAMFAHFVDDLTDGGDKNLTALLPYFGLNWFARASDEHGRIVWDNLPRVDSIRWGAFLNEGRVEIDPPFEKTDIAEARNDGGVNLPGRRPLSLSGRISFGSSDVARSRGVVYQGVVKGRLQLHTGSHVVGKASLMTRYFKMVNNTGFARFLGEHTDDVADTGLVEFHGVKPGTKTIFAQARRGQERWFYSRRFEFAGGVQDLGTVAPLDAGQVRLQFPTESPPGVKAKVVADIVMTATDQFPPPVRVQLEIAPNAELVFHGVLGRRFTVVLELESTHEGAYLEQRDFAMESEPVMRIPVRIRTNQGYELHIDSTGGAEPKQFRYMLIFADGSTASASCVVTNGTGVIRGRSDSKPTYCFVWGKLASGAVVGTHESLASGTRRLTPVYNGRLVVEVGKDDVGHAAFLVPRTLADKGIRSTAFRTVVDDSARIVFEGLKFPCEYTLRVGGRTKQVKMATASATIRM